MLINTVFIAGPTAVGKSKVAIDIAKRINGEIISCDSIQVYKDMDIGTAKIKPEEQEDIPHYLIDIVSPNQEYNVKHFKDDCQKRIHDIKERNKIPLIVGGTGLYMSSVLFNYNMADTKPDYALRQMLEKRAHNNGIMALHQDLVKYDPVAAKKIDPSNLKRVIRALEICIHTNKPLHELQSKNTSDVPLNPCIIGLNMNREILHQRIEERVDKMLKDGLVEEVRNLKKKYPNSKVAFEGIGYKEVISYLQGLSTFLEMRERIIINTRQLAKRQISWFKRYENIHWLMTDKLCYPELIDNILRIISKSFKVENRNEGE